MSSALRPTTKLPKWGAAATQKSKASCFNENQGSARGWQIEMTQAEEVLRARGCRMCALYTGCLQPPDVDASTLERNRHPYWTFR